MQFQSTAVRQTAKLGECTKLTKHSDHEYFVKPFFTKLTKYQDHEYFVNPFFTKLTKYSDHEYFVNLFTFVESVCFVLPFFQNFQLY